LSERNSYDFGIDLAFLNNRISVSASRFKVRDHALWLTSFSPIPGPPSFFELGELHNKGYEISLSVASVQTEKASMKTRLNFYKYDIIIEPKEDSTPGDPVSLGSTIPKWQGSIFNQLKYGAVFMNVLFDIQKGGDIVIADFSGPLMVVDGSFSKFRDISVGYSFTRPSLKNLRLTAANISVSGRNLIALDDDDRDAEQYTNYSDYLRSVSLSLSVTF
jgi:hypothetical protein